MCLKPYPREFRDDVVRVAPRCRRKPGRPTRRGLRAAGKPGRRVETRGVNGGPTARYPAGRRGVWFERSSAVRAVETGHGRIGA